MSVQLPPLKIRSTDEEHEAISAILRQRAGQGEFDILEAGCGRKWRFELNGARFRITGVDSDERALEVRKNTEKDLDVSILGDLRKIDLRDRSFDVVYSAYVLEHIEGAEAVLEKFVAWLKPGGLMILYIPDRESVYGFLAKVTPQFFHVFFYRYILGQKNAGRPGFNPYPTYYDDVVSRRGIAEFAEKHRMKIVEEFGYYRPGGLAEMILRAVGTLSSQLTKINAL